MSIFIADTSTQGTGTISSSTFSYPTTTNPNIKMRTNCGIYNSADNTIKIFTNGTDALTIDNTQRVICNGSLITNLDYNNITLNNPNFNNNSLNIYVNSINANSSITFNSNNLFSYTLAPLNQTMPPKAYNSVSSMQSLNLNGIITYYSIVNFNFSGIDPIYVGDYIIYCSSYISGSEPYFLYRNSIDRITFCADQFLLGTSHIKVYTIFEDLL